MALKKIAVNGYPTRQWAIVGYPDAGKSTFAARMRGPLLTIDADHRFGEVVRSLRIGNAYELGDRPEDVADVRRIAELLKRDMPGSDVGTIVVDSLTAIIAPLVNEAVMANDAGANKNRMSAFKDKALAMRTLQDAVTSWGRDTLWIYHLRDGRDANANKIVSTTISPVELARLRRSLNMVLRVVNQDGKRGIAVDWAREGRSGLLIMDGGNMWEGMPEAIERAVYDGLTDSDRAELKSATPQTFASMGDAIAWGYDQGCFRDAVHAQNTYNKVKEEGKPKAPAEMWKLWIDAVLDRVSNMAEVEEVEII